MEFLRIWANVIEQILFGRDVFHGETALTQVVETKFKLMLKDWGPTKRFTLGTIIEIVKMKEDMNILLIVQGDLGEKCTLTSQHWVVFFMD